MSRRFYFLCEKGNESQLGMGFFLHKRIITAVKKEQFVSDRMSHFKRSLM
jgi:hypothetical protein